MRMKQLFCMIIVFSAQPLLHASVLKIENNTALVCEVQPVVDDKDLTRMGSFKYKLNPGESVSYNSGVYSIDAVRWRTNVYLDNNTKWERSYYLARLPKISVFNIFAIVQIGSNGKVRYHQDRNDPKLS